MARDYVTLSAAPVVEECAQVGSPDYHERVRIECRAFIMQLRRQFGNEPASARLRVMSFPHDFGTYHEVVCCYDLDDDVAVEYAFKLDAELPEKWDDQALFYLERAKLERGPFGVR